VRKHHRSKLHFALRLLNWRALDTLQVSAIGANRDLVYQFTSGIDKIDLRGIDADINSSFDQAFVISTTVAAANSVWAVCCTRTLVRGDLDGVSIADVELQLMNVTSVTAADFLL
jgi:hypothetical protein